MTRSGSLSLSPPSLLCPRAPDPYFEHADAPQAVNERLLASAECATVEKDVVPDAANFVDQRVEGPMRTQQEFQFRPVVQELPEDLVGVVGPGNLLPSGQFRYPLAGPPVEFPEPTAELLAFFSLAFGAIVCSFLRWVSNLVFGCSARSRLCCSSFRDSERPGESRALVVAVSVTFGPVWWHHP